MLDDPSQLPAFAQPWVPPLATQPQPISPFGEARLGVYNTIQPRNLASASLTPVAPDQPSMDDSRAKSMVLNKISSGEAQDYNVLYGGHTFSSFASHPNIPVPIPNSDKYSTAAGRYQFIKSTWDAEAAKLGLKDFSPGNQDIAAWDLANTTYRQQTGRDLLADAKAGNVKWSALGGQWESLKGSASGPGLADSKRHQQAAPASMPSEAPSKDKSAKTLQSLALLQAFAPHVKFTPIDYNPWALQPKVAVNG